MLRTRSVISLRALLLTYEACALVLTYRPRRSPVPLFVLAMLVTPFMLEAF